MALFSIPDIATTEKYGQAAKKKVKHQAAARARPPGPSASRWIMWPTRSRVSASASSVVARVHDTGSWASAQPSAVHRVHGGEEKPNTGVPGL